MTNTDRLAQFIEQMDMLAADFYKYQEGDPKVPFVIVRDATLAALNEYADVRAALASLSPAADVVRRAQDAYEDVTGFADYRNGEKGMRAALAVAYPTLTAKVAALTAQCEGLRKDFARLDYIEAHELHLVSHRETFASGDGEYSIWWNVTDPSGEKSVSGHPLGSLREAIDSAIETLKEKKNG